MAKKRAEEYSSSTVWWLSLDYEERREVIEEAWQAAIAREQLLNWLYSKPKSESAKVEEQDENPCH